MAPPKEGSLEVKEADLKIISTSLDPRVVRDALSGFRFISHTETLHHRFTDVHGLIHLMACLKRYMWNPSICFEAVYLIAGFSANHGSHKTLLSEGVVDVMFALACTHAKLSMQQEEEANIILYVVEAFSNLLSNEDKHVRQVIVERDVARLAGLLSEMFLDHKMGPIVPENAVATKYKTRLVNAGKRLRRNLEKFGRAECWDGKSKRDRKYDLNKNVYMLTERGERFWKLPK